MQNVGDSVQKASFGGADCRTNANSQGCSSTAGNLLILGAGQYGVMAKEIAEAMGIFGKIAFLDDSYVNTPAAPSDSPRHPEQREGSCSALIGTFKDLLKFATEFSYGFVAIGNPALRRHLTEQLLQNNMTPAKLVHPTAYVSPSAQLQKGCCIEPNATVQAGAVVAAASFVSSGAVIRHNAFIGEFCHVDCNVVVESLAIVPAGTKIPCNSVYCQEQGLGLEGHNFGTDFAPPKEGCP